MQQRCIFSVRSKAIEADLLRLCVMAVFKNQPGFDVRKRKMIDGLNTGGADTYTAHFRRTIGRMHKSNKKKYTV